MAFVRFGSNTVSGLDPTKVFTHQAIIPTKPQIIPAQPFKNTVILGLQSKLKKLIASGQPVPRYSELYQEERLATTEAEYNYYVKSIGGTFAEIKAEVQSTPIVAPMPVTAQIITQPEAIIPLKSEPIQVTTPTVQEIVPTPTAQEIVPTPKIAPESVQVSPALAPMFPLAKVAEETANNPFLFMTEEQLIAEKEAVDSAILYRQSQGLSATGEYKDMTLVELFAKRALIMAAYTPILIKKYGLYAVMGLGLILFISMSRRNRKKR